jgi:hypothetical protein
MPLGVDFEESETKTSRFPGRFDDEEKEPKMVSWLIGIGIVKDQKQANYILVGFVVVAVILSFILFSAGSKVSKRPPMTPEQRSFMETGHGL